MIPFPFQSGGFGLTQQPAAGGGGGGDTHLFWRLNISAAQSGGYVSIAEIEFRATPGGADQATGGTPSASSSYNPAYTAAAAFDGNPGSEWASGNGFPHWIRYEFASAVEVQQVAVQATDAAYGGPNERPLDFAIEYSDDGSAWTVARTVTGQTGWTDSEIRLFSVP